MLHLLVAVLPLPVLLLEHPPGASLVLVVGLVLGAAALVAGVGVWLRRVAAARADSAGAAAQEQVEAAVALLWQDWLDAETEQGVRELERWRRSRRS